MRYSIIAASALVSLAAACAQQEEPAPVYVQPPLDKYGNIADGYISDGYYVTDDGTVVGPVAPEFDDPDGDGNRNRNQNRQQTEQQLQQQQQQEQQRRQGGA